LQAAELYDSSTFQPIASGVPIEPPDWVSAESSSVMELRDQPIIDQRFHIRYADTPYLSSCLIVENPVDSY
jgi:hypothetical protein